MDSKKRPDLRPSLHKCWPSISQKARKHKEKDTVSVGTVGKWDTPRENVPILESSTEGSEETPPAWRSKEKEGRTAKEPATYMELTKDTEKEKESGTAMGKDMEERRV